MKNTRHIKLNTLLYILLLAQSTTLNAVNWLMLQGTEPAAVTHRPFLFAQLSDTNDLSDEISLDPNAGKRTVPTTIAPWFNDDSALHFRRASAVVRGNFGV